MQVYSDLLREAKDPPQIEMNGEVYSGRLISFERFIHHVEAIQLAEDIETTDSGPTFADLRSQMAAYRDFLADVFPLPEFPAQPESPSDPTRKERIIHFFGGKWPERIYGFSDKISDWEQQKDEIEKSWAVNVIMNHPDMGQIINKLFSYQWGQPAEEGQPTKTPKSPKKQGSSSEVNPSKKKKRKAETSE